MAGPQHGGRMPALAEGDSSPRGSMGGCVTAGEGQEVMCTNGLWGG